MDKIQITPVDAELETNGVWADYYGVQLLIARANNDAFSNKFRSLSKPHRRQIDAGTLPERITKGILVQSMAFGLLLGWKGLKSGGVEVTYSKANAESLLSNDADCREFVTDFAANLSNYYQAEIEEISGKP